MPKRKTITLNFVCQVCDHHFKQRVPALYVDIKIMQQQVASNQSGAETEAETHSPYIIPQRVVCPTCNGIDRFKLSLSSSLRVTLALFLRRHLPILAPDLIQPIIFGLSDGQQMHPLTALEMYSRKVSRQPKQLELRRKYANLLHNMGYTTEAEAQYQLLLKQDPHALEALLGLAAICAAGEELDQTQHYLKLVAKRAPGSKHPRRQEFLADIQPYLTGELPLDTFEMEFKMLGSATASAPPAPVSLQSGRRKQQSKKRRRRKK